MKNSIKHDAMVYVMSLKEGNCKKDNVDYRYDVYEKDFVNNETITKKLK